MGQLLHTNTLVEEAGGPVQIASPLMAAGEGTVQISSTKKAWWSHVGQQLHTNTPLEESGGLAWLLIAAGEVTGERTGADILCSIYKMSGGVILGNFYTQTHTSYSRRNSRMRRTGADNRCSHSYRRSWHFTCKQKLGEVM